MQLFPYNLGLAAALIMSQYKENQKLAQYIVHTQEADFISNFVLYLLI